MAISDYLKKGVQTGYKAPAKTSSAVSTPTVQAKPQTNWYKGAQPTARETGAQVYRVGMQDPSQQAELNSLFEAELVNPNGPIYSPYLKANSTNYTQTNQKNTYNAAAEWDAYQKELRYWAGRTDRNYSDDEIIRKIDMKKYPTLAKMDESAAMGQPMALLADIGYSQDAKYGVLWAARNPDASTGDAFMDSIQGTLGRGNQFKANDVNSWRDATSDSYAPYKAGATALDDLAYKYRMDGAFDMEWLNSQQGLALLNGDEQMKKDYNRIYQIVTQTDKIDEELQRYRSEVNSAIAAGMDPRAVFDAGKMAKDYPELWNAYEGQRSGKLTETSRALDFDFNADVLAVQDAYLKKTGTMDDSDFANDVAALLGLPTMNNDTQKAVALQTNEQLQAAGSIFAKNFTPAEASAMYTASAGYMPTKQQMAQAILNGTAGENEAYTSAINAANAYATEFWLNSVNRLKELEAEKEAMAKYLAFDEKWSERLSADPFNAQFDPEYMAENEAMQAAVSVAEKYGFDMAQLDAAIENEKRVQANVLQRFADAEKHNTTGAAGNSVMPLLTFVNEFSGYEGGQRYANTAWGEQLQKGESWEKVSKSIADQEKNNIQLLRMIETALRQAGEHGLNSDYTKGLMAFRDELIGETELMQYDKLRGNADFESTVKNFSVPSNTNPILMVIDDPETFYRTADEQTLAFGAPVSRMTDAEKDTYKYVYATQGPEAAADYYSRLEPMLNVRMSEEAEAQAKEDADNAWFGGTVMSALVNLGGAYSMFDNALKTLSGQEVDPYGMNFLGQRYSQTVREEVKKNIDENFGEWADVLNLGYDVLATGMDQAAALAMGGGQEFFTLALQSGAAGNASLMDAYLMGGNDLQAWGKAGIATIAEYFTEKGPLGNLLDAYAKGGTGVFKDAMKRQMLAEGLGEGITEIVNTVSDNVIMQELSQYNAAVEQYMAEGYTEEMAKRMAGGDAFNNILYSGFLGAVSSAPTTAASYAAGALNKRKQNKFKSRAEAALSKAQSDGAGKPAQAAAMAAAMEAGGSNPEDADAAASAMVQADPQATYTLWSILDHSTDFEAVPAVELGALVPDSQTGNLFAMIKEEGATDENVAQLIETANQEMADPEVKAKYDAAIASYAEGTSTIAAMVGADLSGIQNAQKNAENASRMLQNIKSAYEYSGRRLNTARLLLDEAQKAFSIDHSDHATANLLARQSEYRNAKEMHDTNKAKYANAQKDYDSAKAELETVKQNTLAEIRQQGVTARDQIMANRQAVQEQKAAEAEANREAGNTLSLEADNFVNEYFDTAPEDVKADIKERYMTYDGETRKVTRDMSSFASQISKKFNLSIKFTDSHSIFEGAYTGGNQIVLDKNATQGDVIKRVLVHEITHAAETSNVYNELADAVLEAYYGDNKKQIEVDIKAKSKQYAEETGQDGADIARAELVAERLAEMLTGNQEAMDRLVAEKPAVATRIWRAIKEFIGKMTGVQNSELDKFIQLEKKLEKALGSRDADKAGAIRFNKKDDFLFNPEGKTLDELLDDVLSEDTGKEWSYLPIGRFTDSFVALFRKSGVEIADVPILMNYRDAYISMQNAENGVYKSDSINYHDMGKEGFKQAILSMERPVVGMKSKKAGKIELVLETKDKKNNSVLAIFELNTSAQKSKKFISAHVVPTMYGRRSVDNYIERARQEGRLVFDKRKEAPQGITQVQYEGDINVAPETSIAQPGIKVNLSIPAKNGEPAAEIIRGGATKFSLTSWNAKEKETVRSNLVQNGYEPDSVDKWIDDVNSVAAIIAADKDRLDYKAADNQVMLKNNQEYVKTLDASTLCAKRLLYQGTFNAIQHELPNTVLTSEDLLHLSDMMNQAGLETPCGVCYVESRRRHLGKFAQEWLDGYEGEYKPTLDEVTTTDGLEELRHSHPEAYQSFVDTMNSKGSANPKVVQLRTDYRGDVRDLTKSQIEKIVKIGGLRVQSFSDFETPHLIDMMQAVLDMSGKKLTSQAYTKVPNFAWVFGDTGIKINLSLLAEGNGLNEDGTLRFSSKEGMDINEAMRLRERYSENVGTILVGVSEEHIRAAMADPRIDYIIPFHKSGWGQNELNLLPVLNSYDNFEDYQNERTIEGYRKNGKPKYGKPKGGNFYPIDYWDYDKSGDENAATYLRMCEEDGRVPKFEQFLKKDSEGHWVAPSGYWKMLIDFKMYDNDGKGAPQKTVQPNFNMEEAVRVLDEYEGGADSLPIAYDIVDRFVAEKKTAAAPGTRFSLPSLDIINRQMAAYRESQQEDTPEGMGQRQFAGQTVQNSNAVPEEYKPTFMMPENLFYEKDTNREQVERAWQRIQQNGFEAEYNRLLEKEDVYDADDTAEANLMMAMALNPNTSDPAVFMSLALRYNEKGTENAQALQARQLFKKMTPTGAQVWVAGKAEKDLKERRRTHQPEAKMVDTAAQAVADSIKDKQGGDELLRLTSGGDFTIDESNNKWGIPLNEQQKALIDQYGLNEVSRPGLFYNRATVKQRMLEAIIATPNPLEVTGLGLNLIQRLEYMTRGEAVATNADLNYIGARMAEFIGAGEEAGGRAAELALARAYEAYGNIKPATRLEKIRAQRYTNMLLSVPSVIRNVIGNALQNTMNAAAHGAAVEVDKIISKFTGKRTLDHLTVKERADGWAAFVEETKNTFLDYYVDRANTAPNREKYSTSQRGRVFNNGIQEGMRNLENFLMSVGDRNVWKKAFVNSLAEQQRLADQGLLFNTDGTTMTHEQMVEQATKDANYSTFTEDNAVQELMGALAQKHPRIADVISVYLPFTGVPSNIVKRSLQFSPVGLAYTLGKWGVDSATHTNFDQRTFADNLARGLTGTGLMVAGALLAKFGMIKLGTEDEEGNKAYDAATAMGEQYTPYVYDPFTDTYVSMSTFAPALSPLVWGTAVMESLKGDEDAANALLNSLMYSTDSIFDASYLSGFSDIFNSQGSFTENLINAGMSNITSQMVPAMITQLANATDPYVRNTKDKNKITEMLKITASKIPGLRQALPEKVDVAGDTVRTKGWWSFIDPFTRTNPSYNEALIEANRLYDLTGDTSMLPSDLLRGRTNTLNVGGGKKLVLENQDKEWYQKRYGEIWTTALMELMASPKYAHMDDDERAEALKKILSDAMSQAKKEAWAKYGSDK